MVKILEDNCDGQFLASCASAGANPSGVGVLQSVEWLACGIYDREILLDTWRDVFSSPTRSEWLFHPTFHPLVTGDLSLGRVAGTRSCQSPEMKICVTRTNSYASLCIGRIKVNMKEWDTLLRRYFMCRTLIYKVKGTSVLCLFGCLIKLPSYFAFHCLESSENWRFFLCWTQ